MLRSINSLLDYSLLTRDGKIGRVTDYYFNDAIWLIHYLVVDTGGWLRGQKVLISPVALEETDWQSRVFTTNLNQEAVENSPPIYTEETVSRHKESQMVEHYNWPAYWHQISPVRAGSAGMPTSAYLETLRQLTTENSDSSGSDRGTATQTQDAVAEMENPNLRSAKEVVGYAIKSQDDTVGQVADFIVDTHTWAVRYMVVDTNDDVSGQKVLIAPEWVAQIDWQTQSLEVDLSSEAIKNAPAYDPTAPVNRDYEVRLYDYYGRPTYW